MELVRWRPRRDVLSVHDELDRAMDRLLRTWMPVESYSGLDWNPRVDIAESDDRFVVKAEIPGVEMGDIDISLVDGNLVIQGEKKHENEEEGKNFYRVERSYGSFKRVFALPSRVDVENVSASYEDGVLSVTIPKTGEVRSRKIEIEKPKKKK